MDGLWRTTLVLKNDIAWFHLKYQIEDKTSIPLEYQQLTPNARNCDKCLLENGDDIMCESKFKNGEHPLHYASALGNIGAIHSWIASGTDVNITKTNGLTPLMLACYDMQEEAVVELLQSGANVHNTDVDGRTALQFSVFNWCYSIETKNIIKILIMAGCDPMVCNKKGETIFDIHKTHKTIADEIKKFVEETMEEKMIK